MDRLRHRFSFFGNIQDSSEVLKSGIEEEDEKEFIHPGKRAFQDIKRHHAHSQHKKHDFDLPELMKYGDYDKKAWNLFKRHQDDI